jgi:hypothetical protein
VEVRVRRKALIVGINHYERLPRLYGCVRDAIAVARVLGFHGTAEEDLNFHCTLLTCDSADEAISRRKLKDEVEALFAGKYEVALFYFAGHGHIEATGGYLCSSECERGDEGLGLGAVMDLARKSSSPNTVIALDSCHSGAAGEMSNDPLTAQISQGMTILTASTSEQYANEVDGGGVFTTLFVDALKGAAANLLGDISPASVYAHIDQSLGASTPRPVFRTNVQEFTSLRKVTPPITKADLRRLPELFPDPDEVFRLDPTFEPDMVGRAANAPAPVHINVERYQVLQRCNRVNLVVPVDAPHMWHAAMTSTGCRLTALGKQYRRLAKDKMF